MSPRNCPPSAHGIGLNESGLNHRSSNQGGNDMTRTIRLGGMSRLALSFGLVLGLGAAAQAADFTMKLSSSSAEDAEIELSRRDEGRDRARLQGQDRSPALPTRPARLAVGHDPGTSAWHDRRHSHPGRLLRRRRSAHGSAELPVPVQGPQARQPRAGRSGACRPRSRRCSTPKASSAAARSRPPTCATCCAAASTSSPTSTARSCASMAPMPSASASGGLARPRCR